MIRIDLVEETFNISRKIERKKDANLHSCLDETGFRKLKRTRSYSHPIESECPVI